MDRDFEIKPYRMLQSPWSMTASETARKMIRMASAIAQRSTARPRSIALARRTRRIRCTEQGSPESAVDAPVTD